MQETDSMIKKALQACDFSKENVKHREVLLKALQERNREIPDEELDFVSAAGAVSLLRNETKIDHND